MTDEAQTQTTGPLDETIIVEAVPLTPAEEAIAAQLQADNAIPVEDKAAAANYAAAAAKAEKHTLLSELHHEVHAVEEAGAEMVAYPVHLIKRFLALIEAEI